jgi:O-antigen ligase
MMMTYVLAAVIILALPAFMSLLRGSSRRRRWAFCAIGLLPMLNGLPIEGFIYGWPTWQGISRGLSVSIPVMLSLALVLTRPRMRVKPPFLGLFGFYALPLLFSIFFASVWLATVFVWWQFLCVLVVFYAIAGEGHKLDVRASILTGFALGLLYQAANLLPQKLSGVVQAAGTFGHQNVLGLAIELTLLPILAAALGGDRRMVLLSGVAAALICIAGTGSRGTIGIAGLAIVLLICMSLARRATSRKFGIAALGVLALAIATPFAIGTLNDRFQGGSLVTSETEREGFENAARAMVDKHPFGVGANQFVLVSNRDGYADRFGIPWQMADRSMPVHNAYLLARAETGWLGEVSFVLILFVPMILALRTAFRDRKFSGGEVLIGSAVALIANMAHNNYEFAVHTMSLQQLLFINLGMIAAELRNRKVSAQPTRR